MGDNLAHEKSVANKWIVVSHQTRSSFSLESPDSRQTRKAQTQNCAHHVYVQSVSVRVDRKVVICYKRT